MTNKNFILRSGIAIAICLTVLTMLSGCSKKDDPNGNDNSSANGQIEFNGKKYPVNEGSVIISGSSAPYDYVLSVDEKNGGNSVVFALKGSSASELSAGTYTMDSGSMNTFPLYTLDGDLSALELTYYVDNPSLNIQKSGSDYNITFTGTTSDISGAKQYDFKLTYKGTVSVIKL